MKNTATETTQPAMVFVPSSGTTESFAGLLFWATEVLQSAQKHDSLFDASSTVLSGLDEVEVLDNLNALEKSLVAIYEELNGKACWFDQREMLDDESRHFFTIFKNEFDKFYARVKKYQHGLENFVAFNPLEAAYA